MRIGIIIPARDEEASVGGMVQRCLASCSEQDEMRVVVCDNDSNDRTAERAKESGAEIVKEAQRGYGAACLKAIAHLDSWPDCFLFLDADGSSPPEEMERLLPPIRSNAADLVLGHRKPEPGSMTLPQRWGGWLATTLIAWRWGVRYHDLGPFRAIRREAYEALGMCDQTWGWTIEMQIRAILCNLRGLEVEVSWLPRIAGRSKISGTPRDS